MLDTPDRRGRCSHGFLPPLCPQCDKPQDLKLQSNGEWTHDRQTLYRGAARVDMTDQRIGHLLVTGEASCDPRQGPRWRCRCDCGRDWITSGHELRRVMLATANGKRERPYSCPHCRPHRRNVIKPEDESRVLV